MASQEHKAHLQAAISTANPTRLPDPAEIEKLKAEWRREQRGLEQEHSQRRAELLALRGQLNVVQQKLDGEVRARRVDANRASGIIATLERQLDDAGKAAAKFRTEAEQKRHVRLRLSAISTLAALFFASLLAWRYFSTPPSAAPVKVAETVPVATPVRPQPEVARLPVPPQAFSQSLGRLSDALGSIPEQPEAVLKAIREKNGRVCSFQWNGGQPALVYGGGSSGLSLASTLDHCADAVEKYR